MGVSKVCFFLGALVVMFQETDIECSRQPSDEPDYTSCESHPGALPRQRVTLPDIGDVLCDTVTDGGNWIVMQRRMDGSLDFYRTIIPYTYGFGNYNGEFWLGLENVHELCFEEPFCELRIDLEYGGQDYYAKYSQFYLEGEPNHYRLHVHGYSGTAGDSFSDHDGSMFSAWDQDQDNNGLNCAWHSLGAWWYNNCHFSNLNGQWNSSDYGKGMIWERLTQMTSSVTFSEMKIRPATVM